MTRSRKGAELLTAYESGSLSFKNRIINGSFDVWQRGTSFSNGAGGVSYAADRWRCGSSGVTTTITKDADTPSGMYGNSLKIVDGGNSYTYISQRIEAANATSLANKKVTVSFWIKATSYSKATVTFATANASDNFSVTTVVTAVDCSSQITLNTWSYVTVSATMTAAAQNGVEITLFSNYAYGATTTAYFYNVQLELGSTATSFDYRPYGTELALCQRYYTQTASGRLYLGGGIAGNSAGMAFTHLPVTMRATPTVGVPASIGYYSGGNGSSAPSNPSYTASNPYCISYGGSSFTTYNGMTGDYLTASAEL